MVGELTQNLPLRSNVKENLTSRGQAAHTTHAVMNLRALRRPCTGAVIVVLLAMAALALAPALVQRADAGQVLLGLYSRVEVNGANINSMLDVTQGGRPVSAPTSPGSLGRERQRCRRPPPAHRRLEQRLGPFINLPSFMGDEYVNGVYAANQDWDAPLRSGLRRKEGVH